MNVERVDGNWQQLQMSALTHGRSLFQQRLSSKKKKKKCDFLTFLHLNYSQRKQKTIFNRMKNKNLCFNCDLSH